MDDRTERRILEKVTYVSEAVSLLAEVRDDTTLEEYRSDRRTRDVVERELQTAIEACIEVGTMLLAAEDVDVPDRNAEVFRALRTRGMLDDETTERMVTAAGFRNVLAHQYGTEIDDEVVFEVLQEDLDVFPRYLERVREELAE